MKDGSRLRLLVSRGRPPWDVRRPPGPGKDVYQPLSDSGTALFSFRPRTCTAHWHSATKHIQHHQPPMSCITLRFLADCPLDARGRALRKLPPPDWRTPPVADCCMPPWALKHIAVSSEKETGWFSSRTLLRN
ncbi:uncharacterized protein LOC143517302 [Brachyhypopomus gauderio]|uniref:uncharacterized protein LOC143517302 n=1 Tax=Brachyhypopomus gauderio TaxID=698409 RepID=UPI0040432BA3